MDDPKVIHLVSNATEHPENTAGRFKVTFNNTFNLSGKKVALTDVTLTKSNENVKEEKLQFHFKSKPTFVTTFFRPLKPRKNEVWTNPTDFFKRLTQDFSYKVDYYRPAKVLLSCKHEYFEDQKRLHVTIVNKSKYVCVILVRRDYWKPLDLTNITSNRNTFQITIPAKTTRLLKFDTSILKFNELGDVNKYKKFLNKMAFDIHLKRVRVTNYSTNTSKIFQPGPNHFKNIEELLLRLNQMPDFKKLATLSLQYGKVVFKPNPTIDPCTVYFGGLENHFGFDTNYLIINKTNRKTAFVAQRPPNMNRGTHHFYIYCSLVKNVMINNMQAPLLATVDATKGEYGEQIMHPVLQPIYLEAVEGPQQVIEVEIADDTGNRIGLLMGRTKLTLAVSDL